jgi:hypothetical protein
MHRLSFFIILLLLTFIYSCKPDENKNDSAKENESIEETLRREGYTRVLSTEEKEKMLTGWRAEADAILDYRRQQDNNKTWAILTTGVWNYNAIMDSGSDTIRAIEKGKWIRFGDDLRFEKGHYSEIEAKGKYHYSADNRLLILQYDDENSAPEEHDTQISKDMMAWSGQMTFKNNGTMIQFLRSDQIPKNDE